jgi:hypothetical protein
MPYFVESNFTAPLVQNTNESDTMRVSSVNFSFVMCNCQGHDATVYTWPNIHLQPMVQMFAE